MSPLAPIDDLLETLDLQAHGSATLNFHGVPHDEETELGTAEIDVFIGKSQKMPHGRVFGGQVLAQSVIAAGRTVGEVEPGTPRPIHSLHAYFMRPGDDSHPIRFAVERSRDGRSFSTRRVQAIQFGKPILTMTASFQELSGGLDHQDTMPDVLPAEALRDTRSELAALGVDDPRVTHVFAARPIEQRWVEGTLWDPSPGDKVARQNVWLKAVGRLPDDPLLHAAVLAYSSDYALLEPVLRRHGIRWLDDRLRIASLDHAMWFHRPVRMDEWVLYSQQSPSAISGRGLGVGRMFSHDGRLVASVAQEGMIRLKSTP